MPTFKLKGRGECINTQGVNTQKKTPFDYLSPESQKELLASKAKVKEQIETFKNPAGIALVALSISNLISEAIHSGFIDKTETERFMEVLTQINAISTKMANEAFDKYEAEQAVSSGLTQEA